MPRGAGESGDRVGMERGNPCAGASNGTCEDESSHTREVACGGEHGDPPAPGMAEEIPSGTAERLAQGYYVAGIELDAALNDSAERGPRRISSETSRITVLVIPTDEELAIARAAAAAVELHI